MKRTKEDWDKYYEELDREQEFNFTQFLMKDLYPTVPDTFREEYPLKGVDVIDEFYRDQAPHNSKFYDREINCFYLQLGIKRMDIWMGKQIRKLGTPEAKFSADKLRELIKANPHLHNVIKTNLLDNLKTYEANCAGL